MGEPLTLQHEGSALDRGQTKLVDNKRDLRSFIKELAFALMAILAISCSDKPQYPEKKMRKTMIIAHRGATSFGKENTIESFKKAIDLAADMIELDVRRTKDHILIVHHDELMEGKWVKELTYDEISRMARDQGFSMATFEEVLKCTREKIKLDIELKEETYEKEVVELLSKYIKRDQYVITSFYDSCIKRIKENYPDIKAGLILGISKPKHPVRTRFSEFFPAKRSREAKADFLVAHRNLLWFGFLERAKRDNKPVFVWTVNDQKRIEKMLQDQRIDAIITDKPDLAIALRQKMNSMGDGSIF
jgi:glycerophosphoryl diester phosphodiesterase